MHSGDLCEYVRERLLLNLSGEEDQMAVRHVPAIPFEKQAKKDMTVHDSGGHRGLSERDQEQ